MKTLALAILAVATNTEALWATPLHDECEKNLEAWYALGFYPNHREGIYQPGEEVTLTLRTAWTNGQAGTIHACVNVQEFDGALQEGVTNFTFTCAKDVQAQVTLPAPKRFGHFTVTASLKRDGRHAGYVQSAFIVAPPCVENPDPWFTIDKNYYVDLLACKLNQMGFGGAFVSGGSALQALVHNKEELERHYKRLLPANRTEALGNPRFNCMGEFAPNIFKYKPAVQRVQNGFPALTEEELLRIREHARRCAELLADRVDVWTLQEEYDAFFNIQKDNVCNDHFLWMAAFANILRNAAEGLRAGNPKCKITVLGMCCNEYFWLPEKWQFAKLILPTLKGHFDCVAMDAYSGNWNGFNGKLTPPEDIFTDLLRSGAKLSKAFGGSNEVVIAERCGATDWFAAYDGPTVRDQADYTARSLILAKSVPTTSRYSLHVLRDYGKIVAHKANPSKRHMCDLGIWRAIELPKAGERWIPRPAVMAAGTVSRKLAYATNPREKALTDNIRLVTFDVPGGKATAALWTSGAPVKAKFPLPRDVTRCDIGGNEEKLASGELEQRLTTTPVFYDMPSATRSAFEKAVCNLAISWRTPNAPNATFIVGNTFGEPIVLAAPKAVRPVSALMPEYGFFKNDKRFMKEGEKVSWPKAEVRFAWTSHALKATINVCEKDYVADVDTAIIEILDPQFFKTGGGELNRAKVAVFKPQKTTGAGKEATHVFEIPWSKVPGGNPGAGGRVALNVKCPCAPHLRDQKVRYALVLCEDFKNTEKLSNRRFHSVFLQYEP